MLSQLITKLRTKDDLEILKGELNLLENSLYQTNKKYEDVLRSDIRSWVSEIILSEIKETNISDYLKAINKQLTNLPILSASINFEPSSQFIDIFSGWLKKNINENIVVDLLFNTASLGGVQLSYKGKYLDLSLRKRISQELVNIKLLTK
jgi:hypothetical protein